MLSLEEITLEVGDNSEEPRRLLDAISLQMRRGQFVGVIGPSGCGKSTLLKIIAGLTDPTDGAVRWDGRDLATEGDLPPAELGYVPQFSLAHELLTVRECVDYAARLRVDGTDADARAGRVETLLKTVGLDTLADRQARVLSGGQRRRLSLAIETISSPSLLLCDEVTSGLDPGSAHEIMKLLHALSRADGGARRIVVNVTHSLADMELYDRVVVLTGGCLAFDAAPGDLAHYFRVETPDEVYPRLALRKPGQWMTSWLKHGPYYYGQEAERLHAAPAPAREEPIVVAVPTSDAPSATLGGLDETRPDESDGIPTPPPPAPIDVNNSAEVSTPGNLSQFWVVFERRLRLFARDRTQVALQAALIVGFPCLVVIFALRGLPGIRNLSMDNGQNIVDQLRESTDYLKQAFEVGGLVSGLLLFQIILLALMGSNNGALEVAGERLLLESEKLAGLSSGSYVAAKVAFLAILVTAQAFWMAIFVHLVCGFPGDLFWADGVAVVGGRGVDGGVPGVLESGADAVPGVAGVHLLRRFPVTAVRGGAGVARHGGAADAAVHRGVLELVGDDPDDARDAFLRPDPDDHQDRSRHRADLRVGTRRAGGARGGRGVSRGPAQRVGVRKRQKAKGRRWGRHSPRHGGRHDLFLYLLPSAFYLLPSAFCLLPSPMARRANSKIRPLWIALTLGALVLAIVVGAVLQNTGGDPYRTVPPLDLGDYLNNANSLRGNVYKVKGQIMQSLGYSRAKGHLFSVQVDGDNARGTGIEHDVLPILVPPELSYLNLQKGQKYIFRLEVGDAGLLTARDMKKS